MFERAEKAFNTLIQIEIDNENLNSFFNSLNTALFEFFNEYNQLAIEYKFCKLYPVLPMNIYQKDLKKLFCWNNYVYIIRSQSITSWSLRNGSIKSSLNIDVENAFIYKKRLVIYNEDTIYLYNMTLTNSSKKTFTVPDKSKISCVNINNDIISCGTVNGQIIGWTITGGKPIFAVTFEENTPILATINTEQFFFSATDSKITRWEYAIDEENQSIEVKSNISLEYKDEPILQFYEMEKKFYAITSRTIHLWDILDLKYIEPYQPKKIKNKKIPHLVSKNFWIDLTIQLPNIVIGVVHRPQ